MSVLLLTASHRPIKVISDQHAVRLMLRDVVYKAPAAKEREIATPSHPFILPNILCLKQYHNVPNKDMKWSKTRVLNRDGYTCIYCGVSAGGTQKGRGLSRRDFTLEHIRPRSRGGLNTWGNTACACRSCNNRKGDRMPHECGMTLLWEPKRPRTSYLVVSTDILPEEWKIYIEID